MNKKIILVFAVAVISVLGCVNIADASDVRLLCSLTGKITDVTNDYVYFVATGKSLQGFLLEGQSGQKCLSYNISYRFTRPLRTIFLKDQKVFIELSSITAMGPNGPTPSSEEWNIKSEVDVPRPFNISIQPEKIAESAPDIIIENNTYTIKELNTNTSVTPRKFFTEAYVIGGEFNIQQCPIECPDLPPAHVNLADTLSVMNSVYILTFST